jgi:hypothetical protein
VVRSLEPSKFFHLSPASTDDSDPLLGSPSQRIIQRRLQRSLSVPPRGSASCQESLAASALVNVQPLHSFMHSADSLRESIQNLEGQELLELARVLNELNAHVNSALANVVTDTKAGDLER